MEYLIVVFASFAITIVVILRDICKKVKAVEREEEDSFKLLNDKIFDIKEKTLFNYEISNLRPYCENYNPLNGESLQMQIKKITNKLMRRDDEMRTVDDRHFSLVNKLDMLITHLKLKEYENNTESEGKVDKLFFAKNDEEAERLLKKEYKDRVPKKLEIKEK